MVGREAELGVLEAFLERPADAPRTLVLEGEAGIGKTTLWLAGVEAAREQGFRVLWSRPAEAERGLAFAALGDLLEPVLDRVLPSLSRPRRRALEVALLLDESKETADPRALGVAVRNGLEILAAERPLVVAIDDVQWLDPASERAIAFALRRLAENNVFLLARRIEAGAAESGLETALAPGSVERMAVGPLSVGATQALLRAQLDRAFARPTLLRIHEMAGGNPFYALEIARALPEELDPMQPLPVPATLDELLRARIEALPESSRTALVLLSAVGEADEETLRMAQAAGAIHAAVSHGIVERVAGRLRFSHPLLASSVYLGADDVTRRSSHAALAEVIRDPQERARHLALAAEGPDAGVAASLDQAATSASARGAPNVAAELGELARRLTPPEDREGRHRRAILGATSHLRAGDVQRARTLAEEAVAEAEDDRSHAEALVLTSAVAGAEGSRERAIALRREALSEAAAHPALRAAIHQWLAANVPYSEGIRTKERHARTSLDLAEQLADDVLRAGALAVLARVRFEAGEPDAIELAQQAHALATRRVARDVPEHSSTELVHLLAWTYDRLDEVASFVLADMLIDIGRLERARVVLDGLERELAGRDELLQAKTLWLRGALELDAGNWRLAHDLLEREREIDALYESAPQWPSPLVARARLAMHWGEVDRARQFATRAREFALAADGLDLAHAEAALGLVERAAGLADAAIRRFAAAEAIADGYAWREPTIYWWRTEFAEALLELDRVDDAVQLLDAWEPNARRLGRKRILAHIARCRGLVAASGGHVEEALSLLDRAVDEADAQRDPFGHARALLALGVVRRRARQKRGAREAIAAALAQFEALGEVAWTKRAQAELGRVSGRRREEGLTAAERRVAALVVDGRTNREVAAVLSLGERTVETHLTHIYAKLGVRSRTELARVHGLAP